MSVSTHRQALSALLFLYQQVLGQQLPWMDAIGRPQRRPWLPVVLSPGEVASVLAGLEGTHKVLAQLLYGTGMRITEALQLHVKDVEFERRVIVVRSGKGGKDRVVMLPATLAAGLREQMQRARVLWEADARAGRGGVQMPDALERKYPRTGVERRHHLFDQTFQRAFKRALQAAGIERPATPHTLRHSFATHLLQSGTDIGFGRFTSRGLRPHEPSPQHAVHVVRTVQELLGHSDVSTTMIYTHVLKAAAGGTRSPLDALAAGITGPHPKTETSVCSTH